MDIEFLFEELYIYGEKANADYFRRMFKDSNFHITKLVDKPFFVDKRPDIIFIGPMVEPNLDKVVKKLLPYKDRLKELIEDGVYFIAFNNVLDILGKELIDEKFGEKETLGLFDYTAKRNFRNRLNVLVAADFKDTIVLGANITFSQYYGNENSYIYTTLAGFGFSKDSKLGGFRYKNCFLIEMLGNLFIYNPQLSKIILKHFNIDSKLPFENEAFKSYNERLESWKNKNIIK